MNAKQAKEKALAVNIENGNSQYVQIIIMISNAANIGKYEIWFYKDMQPDVKKKLIDEGYTVNIIRSIERDDAMTKISWS